MKKTQAAIDALTSLAYLMQHLEDNYGRLDSMDADFKNAKQQVDMVLSMPDDEAPPAAPAPAVDVAAMLTVMNSKMDGMEGTLATIVTSLPAPAPVPAA